MQWLGKFSVLITFFLLFNSPVKADDWVISVGFANVPSESVNEVRYRASRYFPVWFGVPDAFDRSVGFYVSAGASDDLFKSSSRYHVNNDWTSNQYAVMNAGLSYRLSDYVITYGGLGYAYQKVRIYDSYQSSLQRNHANLNIGTVIKIGSFGINLSYDTAPNAFGIGFVISSSTFQ